MNWMRALGNTGLQVSALGLGTVKLGRDRGVKYPDAYSLPDDRSAALLLDRARELGINLLDTAPAYGSSEQRLGRLLAGQRQHWLLCTKVGEEFANGRSHYDFSPEHVRRSVERSLRRLATSVLDIVLVHSDGSDLDIIERMGTLQALAQLRAEGLVRAIGMSTKTVAGGLAAARVCDVVMLTYNPQHREELPVLDACTELGTGTLIKKVLGSGHLAGAGGGNEVGLQACMNLAFSHPGTGAAIVGTINRAHLEANVAAARRALGGS